MPAAVKVLDLHHMNTYQASVAIEAALRRSWGVYTLRLVHGHHSGTVLRDFIWQTYQADPRILRLEAKGPSITDLCLRAL